MLKFSIPACPKKFIFIPRVKIAIAIISLGWLCSAQENLVFNLHPTTGFRAAHSAQVALPFSQSVPLSKGKLFPKQLMPDIYLSGQLLPGQVKAAAHWSDGSIQWLTVNGVWPQAVPIAEKVVLTLGAASATPLPEPAFNLQQQGNSLIINYAGNLFAKLHLEAAVLPINKPKARDSHDPEDYDTRVQYSWAEPLGALNDNNQEITLQPVIREFLLEQDDGYSLLYRIRGNAGDSTPGQDLEWQIRMRIFRHTPVIRCQTTWFLHWSPEQFALCKAQITAEFPQSWLTGHNNGQSYQLDSSSVSLASAYTGRSFISQGEQKIEAEWPAATRHTWTMSNATQNLGIALPNFTRLGPNRLILSKNQLIFACWDGASGLALDTRRSVEPDEFMMNTYDFDHNASGLAKTSEMTWCLAPTNNAASALAETEALRHGLWFPSRADLVATKALGAWEEETYEKNTEYVEGLTGHLHWLMASRDHWRWNGFINYGDIRTNWSRNGWLRDGKKILHPMVWGMNGRYGWRNGSGEPYSGFLTFGLWAQDREIILFAYDYATHVADVDIMHGRFNVPLENMQGGMHRRNKNHWSGAVQTQYTPSRGLYLLKWLTGNERLDDSLAEIRDFTRRNVQGSVFSASAWQNRYAETHNQQDLQTANELLQVCVKNWEATNAGRDEELKSLRGLAALYAQNFRHSLDWWPIQIEFHRITEDPQYLQDLADRISNDPLEKIKTWDLTIFYAVAYLLDNGYTPEQLGGDKVERMQQAMLKARERYLPIIPREDWNFKTLTAKRATSQTFELGKLVGSAPFVLGLFPTNLEK